MNRVETLAEKPLITLRMEAANVKRLVGQAFGPDSFRNEPASCVTLLQACLRPIGGD
jgi:hypothetical protein